VEVDRQGKCFKREYPGRVKSEEAEMGKKNYAVCYTCVRKVEYMDCSEKEPPPKDARCHVLKGWLTVSHWQGMHAVECYDFCSLGCLQKWVDSQVPKLPDVFLEALDDD
jgi:hypothetical protein